MTVLSREHAVGRSGDVVWYGGMGHRLLFSTDGPGDDPAEEQGVQCFRCGMVADAGVLEDLIPDCYGSNGGDHHYVASPSGGECAYGDAVLDWNTQPEVSDRTPCVRA